MPLILYALVGATLCFIPATQILGYEYAWGVVIAGSAFGAWLTRKQRFARMCIAWLVPLALGLANGLRVRNCNPWLGVEWYLVLALPQLVLSWLLAKRAPRLLLRGRRTLPRDRALRNLSRAVTALLRSALGIFRRQHLRRSAAHPARAVVAPQLMVLWCCAALAARQWTFAAPALALFSPGTRARFSSITRARLLSDAE